VNDPPTAFNLLSPVDSFFVHSYPLVEFDWEESVDIVEDSAVVYDLSISFDDSVYSWSGLDDEFKIMPRTFFVIDPDMPTEVSWWVFATDGADTVYSADTASVMIAPIRTQITRTPLIPDKYALGRPYPNPFNNMVSVLVDLPDPSWVKLEVYDLTGGLVASLMNEDLNAGRHLANWNGYTHTGRKAASGSYVVRLRSSMGIKTQRVMLLR
ncbi:MAG: T9SS type A sorting domain-containing protein, partial [Calditrichaeota bacterium]|nr:T9SS type A sorting domain-containing protein [Calditrichota bacterium]